MRDFVEQRRHRRHTAKLSAIAVHNDGLLRRPITIVNLSSGGAKLELKDDAPLPASVTLLFGHSIEPCTVVWQRAPHAGVRFDAPPLVTAA